jgi:hypothetical protein
MCNWAACGSPGRTRTRSGARPRHHAQQAGPRRHRPVGEPYGRPNHSGKRGDGGQGHRDRAGRYGVDSADAASARARIIISDAVGNPLLRAELSYRGFDASPVSGRAQAIAVYQNGVRINEVFGDVVN